jgi:hypothetical protein
MGMDNKLSDAVEVLTAQLNEQMKQVADTKSTINALLRSMGKEAMFQDVSAEQVSASGLRPDLFYGKPLATAVQEYLKRRNQACGADDILRGLEQGGFDFRSVSWKEADRLRSLSISLAKNSVTFHRLPNGTFGLLSWYPDIEKPEPSANKKRERRNGKRKAKQPKPSVEEATKPEQEKP